MDAASFVSWSLPLVSWVISLLVHLWATHRASPMDISYFPRCDFACGTAGVLRFVRDSVFDIAIMLRCDCKRSILPEADTANRDAFCQQTYPAECWLLRLWSVVYLLRFLFCLIYLRRKSTCTSGSRSTGRLDSWETMWLSRVTRPRLRSWPLALSRSGIWSIWRRSIWRSIIFAIGCELSPLARMRMKLSISTSTKKQRTRTIAMMSNLIKCKDD